MKRILALLVALCCISTTFPTVLAAENEKTIDMSSLISITEPGEEYFQKNKEFYDEIGKSFSIPEVEGYSDEDLFGKYDNDNEEWVKTSMLNYEAFPGLIGVESAVVEGDYDKAKEELLKYYREKFENLPLITNGVASNVDTALLMMENIISANNTLVGIFKVDKADENKTFYVDATDILKSSVSSNEATLSLALTAVRRDGNRVVLRSKDAGVEEDAPTLVVTVNGNQRTYRACADTYIRGGDYSQQGFGTESELYCEESYSSIFQPLNKLCFDSYTSRAIINFDISDIGANAKVSGARLYVKGRAVDSDNPVEPENRPEYTDVAVYKYRRASFDESTYCWNDDPENMTKQHTNASGWYSNIPHYGSVSFLPVGSLLAAYNATNEEAYAYASMRQIEGASVEIMGEESGAKLWHSLHLAVTAASFPDMFADIIKTPVVTGDFTAHMLKLIHYVTEVLVNDRWTVNEEGNNWGNKNASAILQLAITFNEFRKASEPLSDYENLSNPGGVRGGWLAVGRYRMDYCTGKFLREDDSCIENSHGYVRYMLGATADIFEYAKKLNFDIHDVFEEEYLEKLEKYLLFLANLSTSDGQSFRQGDDSGEGNVLRNYGGMVEALGNPYLLWVYSEKKDGEAPEYLGYAYDVSQKATMRTGHGENDMSIYINADGSVGSHSHNDDLALNLYAYGKMLLSDRRQEDYDMTTDFGAMFYSTRGHNTIEINSTNMNGKSSTDDITITDPDGEETTIKGSGTKDYVSGTLHPENREFNSMYHYIQAESFGYRNIPVFDENFETVREVLMVSPSYVIVTDKIEPDGSDNDDDENSFAQYWHTIPNANVTINGANLIVKTNFSGGANLTIAPVIGSLPITATKHRAWYNTGALLSDYVRFEKNTSQTATFNTVLYPTAEGKGVEIETNAILIDGFSEADASAFSFSTTDTESNLKSDVYYYNLLDLSKKKDVVFGNYRTDGELALVEEDSSGIKKTVLRNGKSIKTQNGTDIIKSEHTISDLGVQWDGNKVLLSTSKEIAPISIIGGTGTVSDENLALNKASSSSLQYASNASKYAIDGDSDTCWKSATDYSGNSLQEEPWLSVNFGKDEYISQVVVYDECVDSQYTLFCIDENNEWKKIKIESVKTEEAENGIFKKIFDTEPFISQHLKLKSTDEADMTIYELEVYSCLVGAISLYDLKIYAPGKVNGIFLNGESYPVHKNGDYIVFSPTQQENEPELPTVTPPSSTPPTHGDSGSVGGGGGGNTDSKEDKPIIVEPTINNNFKNELKDHWGEKEISKMVERGIVKGDGGSLKLDYEITRAEFSALLIRALKAEEIHYNGEFEDVKGDEWYANTLSTAEKLGLIEGYMGRVSPNSSITREQMAKMLVKAYEYLYPDTVFEKTEVSFSDNSNISPWAIPFVAKAVEKRIMNGESERIFNAQGATLREQAFVALYRILEFKDLK